jgi:hypothetical protein
MIINRIKNWIRSIEVNLCMVSQDSHNHNDKTHNGNQKHIDKTHNGNSSRKTHNGNHNLILRNNRLRRKRSVPQGKRSLSCKEELILSHRRRNLKRSTQILILGKFRCSSRSAKSTIVPSSKLLSFTIWSEWLNILISDALIRSLWAQILGLNFIACDVSGQAVLFKMVGPKVFCFLRVQFVRWALLGAVLPGMQVRVPQIMTVVEVVAFQVLRDI